VIDPCVIDECGLLSIIKMSKTRNKSLYKRLATWYKLANADAIKNRAKDSGTPQPKGGISIMDIIDDIGDLT